MSNVDPTANSLLHLRALETRLRLELRLNLFATKTMEATATAAKLPVASPATVRDVSQAPGPDTVQPQPAEDVPNGVHVNNVGVGDKGTPTSHPATPMPELVRPASETPPLPLPLSAPVPSMQLPATQPPSMQLPATQPPSTQSPSTQSPSTQSPPSPSAQLPSVEPPSTQLRSMQLSSMCSKARRVTPPAMSPQDRLPLSQPQSYRWAPSNAVPPSGPAPPPSQAEQPRQQFWEVNGVPKRFPSPEADHEIQIPRFTRDLSLLADTVQQSSPEAVRRLVRDKWEKCILGSEFHHAFLINAIIHRASGVIMRRAIRDFGQRMVAEAKHEIANHLRPQDLDDIAPAILEKCSDQFLDRVLEHRLGTIDARSLINALARAERLGYTDSDVLEDRRERVVPTARMHSLQTRYVNSVPISQSQPPPAAPVRASQPFQPAQNASPATDLKCRLCWRQFKHTKPYEYHVAKQLCTKPASETQDHLFWCGECGAGFTTKAGHQYHAANAVCGIHVTAAATPRARATTPKPDVPPPTNYAPHSIPPTQLPPTTSQPYSTPHRSNNDLKGTPGSSQDDPYAHLTLQRRAELDEDLRQAELSYAPRFKEAEEIRNPLLRKSKLESLQNTFSTKQSMIRKRYGVRLRVRRTRAEIEEEKSRLGLKHGPSSPNPTTSTPSAKRQRSDDAPNGIGGPSYISRGPGPQTPIPPPSNHLSISQINNSGLGGSTATAATTDPTASTALSQPPPTEEKPPPNSLSSLQRKGYRVSSHVGQSNRTSASLAPRSGSASTPVVLDDSSDGADSDGDIPATLPPRKVS
ncbi:hypothetical protein F4680DRAFT_433554 [Xylaria scruposa]|nr:hypothetical protein F4680DRAFT_433554 [Xylaria scruposa]